MHCRCTTCCKKATFTRMECKRLIKTDFHCSNVKSRFVLRLDTNSSRIEMLLFEPVIFILTSIFVFVCLSSRFSSILSKLYYSTDIFVFVNS